MIDEIGEVLELGVQWCIKNKDIVSFERTIAQLQTYYFDYRHVVIVSFLLILFPHTIPIFSFGCPFVYFTFLWGFL
jgi:hypothetical protein